MSLSDFDKSIYDMIIDDTMLTQEFGVPCLQEKEGVLQGLTEELDKSGASLGEDAEVLKSLNEEMDTYLTNSLLVNQLESKFVKLYHVLNMYVKQITILENGSEEQFDLQMAKGKQHSENLAKLLDSRTVAATKANLKDEENPMSDTNTTRFIDFSTLSLKETRPLVAREQFATNVNDSQVLISNASVLNNQTKKKKSSFHGDYSDGKEESSTEQHSLKYLNTVDELDGLVDSLNRMFKVRDLVFGTTLMTIPMLNAIHQSPDVTMRENELVHLIGLRDKLASIYALTSNKELKTLTAELDTLKQENAKLLASNQRMASTLNDKLSALRGIVNHSSYGLEDKEKRKTGKNTVSKEVQKIKEKKQEQLETLKISKLQCDVLTDFIEGLVSGLGVNWYEERKLREIVLKCLKNQELDEKDEESFGTAQMIRQ